jgi:hypothetical protein
MLRTYAFWHRRAHQDVGNRWLRSRIAALFGGDRAAGA